MSPLFELPRLILVALAQESPWSSLAGLDEVVVVVVDIVVGVPTIPKKVLVRFPIAGERDV